MTGVEASEEMTMEQLEAMSGGELLRNEVCSSLSFFPSQPIKMREIFK